MSTEEREVNLVNDEDDKKEGEGKNLGTPKAFDLVLMIIIILAIIGYGAYFTYSEYNRMNEANAKK